jgi:hypothetical protein
MRLTGLPAIVLGIALGIGPTAIIWAQDTKPQASPSEQDFSEQKLKQFVMAALEVQRINDEYMPKMKTASTPEQRKEIESEALGKMEKAVTDKGLTVDSYKEIYNAARNDPEIAKRIGKHVEQEK